MVKDGHQKTSQACYMFIPGHKIVSHLMTHKILSHLLIRNDRRKAICSSRHYQIPRNTTILTYRKQLPKRSKNSHANVNPANCQHSQPSSSSSFFFCFDFHPEPVERASSLCFLPLRSEQRTSTEFAIPCALMQAVWSLAET